MKQFYKSHGGVFCFVPMDIYLRVRTEDYIAMFNHFVSIEWMEQAFLFPVHGFQYSFLKCIELFKKGIQITEKLSPIFNKS